MSTSQPTAYEQVQARLAREAHTWLVTGVAGFIGSNLLETLLRLDQRVVGLDNFATGYQRNLDEVKGLVSPAQWANFRFIEGDIRNLADCQRAMNFPSVFHPLPPGEGRGEGAFPPLPPGEGRGEGAFPPLPPGEGRGEGAFPSPAFPPLPPGEGRGEGFPVEYILHQAALGSVPRSLEDPILTNSANITGFLNILVAARDASVRSFTYAASSSTYGDHPGLPKVEDIIGKPLSPYAVTKYVNELYADVFARCYGFDSIGLRYFNVFGPRQDPNGPYAAVVPKWIAALLASEPVYINGDGETSRDFCYVANAVQANLLAATVSDLLPLPLGEGGGEGSSSSAPLNQVYNVAVSDRTTLNTLFALLRDNLADHGVAPSTKPVYRDFRAGDVRQSQADIGKAQRLLGYVPTHRLGEGVRAALPWYTQHVNALPIPAEVVQ